MSTRFNLKPQLVANAISMSADGFSLVTDINSISAAGYTISWSSGASGTFQVEVSNDYVPAGPNTQESQPNSGTWVAIPLSSSISSSGSAGTAYADIVGISAAYIRLHFVHTSGSGGAFNATLAGKVQ